MTLYHPLNHSDQPNPCLFPSENDISSAAVEVLDAAGSIAIGSIIVSSNKESVMLSSIDGSAMPSSINVSAIPSLSLPLPLLSLSVAWLLQQFDWLSKIRSDHRLNGCFSFCIFLFTVKTSVQQATVMRVVLTAQI